MDLSGVQEFLWAAAFVAECALLIVLFVRRRAAEFPAFTFLIAFYIARTIVLFNLALRFGIQSRPYFLAFWSLAYADDVLELAVFYELARQVFCPTGVWARDTRRAFRWLIAASVFLALGLSLLASPPFVHWYKRYFLRSDFFASALMSELFVGILVLSATAGLPWKAHVARIAQGFGANALICMLLEGAKNYLGPGHSRANMLIPNAEKFAYLGCACFWIVALWRDAPAPRELPDTMLMQIYTLQRRVENDLIRIRNWRRS